MISQEIEKLPDIGELFLCIDSSVFRQKHYRTMVAAVNVCEYLRVLDLLHKAVRHHKIVYTPAGVVLPRIEPV